jgi:cytoskeleton protein RodZ
MMTETVNEEEPQLKPGTLLKQKRESLGLTQRQIADKLRLRLVIVQSLEENNFELDIVSTFTRGYVRSYAKLLGIDEDTIMSSYDNFCGTEASDLSMQSFSKKTAREQHNSRINLITIGIVIIVIGISSVWWYQNQKEDTLTPNDMSQSSSVSKTPPPETGTSQTTPAGISNGQKKDTVSGENFTTVGELSQRSAEQTEKSAGQSSAVASKADDEGESASSATTQPESVKQEVHSSHSESDNIASQESDTASPRSPKKVSAQPTTVLSVTLSGDCWIRVIDADGKVLSIGVKKAGQRLELMGKTPLKVVLGAPEYVSMTFAGEPVNLSRYTSGKVARFTLP